MKADRIPAHALILHSDEYGLHTAFVDYQKLGSSYIGIIPMRMNLILLSSRHLSGVPGLPEAELCNTSQNERF